MIEVFGAFFIFYYRLAADRWHSSANRLRPGARRRRPSDKIEVAALAGDIARRRRGVQAGAVLICLLHLGVFRKLLGVEDGGLHDPAGGFQYADDFQLGQHVIPSA